MSVSEPTGLDLFPPEASLPPASLKHREPDDPRLLFGSEQGLFVEVEAVPKVEELTPPARVAEEAQPQPAAAVTWQTVDLPEARSRRRLALGLLGAVLAFKLALAFAIRASWIPMPDMFVAAETSPTTTAARAEVPPVTPPPPRVSSPPTVIAPSVESVPQSVEVSRWDPKRDVQPAAMTRPRVATPQPPRPERSRADVRQSGLADLKPTTDSLPAPPVTSSVAPASVSAPTVTSLAGPPPPPAPDPTPLERAPLPIRAAPTSVPAEPPAEPAVRAEVREGAAVERVLDSYREAFSQLDAEATQAVWPTVNVKSLQRAFGQLQSQQVSFRDCAISVAASQAFATCEGTTHYVPKVGSRDPRAENRTWNFTLSRNGQRWVILAVNSR